MAALLSGTNPIWNKSRGGEEKSLFSAPPLLLFNSGLAEPAG
jgi:hypothetical protein